MNALKNSYKAGFCNIGEREIAIRQKLLLFSFGATVLFTILAHFFHSKILYFGLFFSVLSTVITMLEIKTRFCILFGVFSLYNFKEPGNLDDVTDQTCKRKDRLKALQYIIGCLMVTFPYVFIVWFFTR